MSDFIPSVSNYHLQELVYTSSKTLVYRAYRLSDHHPVIIKLFHNPYPKLSDLLQFRNQYTITQRLDFPGIIQAYSLEFYQNGYILVMEDFGGISLKRWIEQELGASRNNPQLLNEFFHVAIQLAETLHYLYRHRVIHKDIKTSNILINPQTRQVKLIDFSIASLLPRETQEIHNFNVLEGTLAYISPEQTGRMNRGIDYRTDFYSLGATFYEMLTGQLPFPYHDPVELVHSHIARIPPSVTALNPVVPPPLAAIVGKLLAKNPEDRYQNALGLKHDLAKCLHHWETARFIPIFPLGEHDISDRFLIPEKLYGRELEVQKLLDAFNRVVSLQPDAEVGQDAIVLGSQLQISMPQPELVLVTGHSGIGKTAVINEVHKPIVRQKSYFVKGKFDQFQRNIPFSAFVQAFRDLMGQLLAEKQTQLQQWQAKILQALGNNAQVIIEVIPELEQIIGVQPPVPELTGAAAQNRFNLILQKFIQVFAVPEHPLVIFLDDLQWIDSASLRLIKVLMCESQERNLLLIGAYRDHEVSPAHPLMLTLNDLCQSGIALTEIQLHPLNLASLNQLVADTLSCSAELSHPLAKLVYQKTQGNPFFATQFLKALHQDQFITFDQQTGYWQCDITRVREAALTDDVVQFMAVQLQKLPPATQNVLKLAACVGNQFDLVTLAIVAEESESETAAALWAALQQGIVLPQSEVYKFYVGTTGQRLPQDLSPTVAYRFLHDRIQQAAYALIPESEKQATHLHIGKLLLQKTPFSQRDEKIFAIVNQLNLGQDQIVSQAQRVELIQLNLVASRKARLSAAYEAAYRYCTIGIRLQLPEHWRTDHETILALYLEAANSACLIGEFEQADRYISTVLQNTTQLLEHSKATEIRIQSLIARNQLVEAIQISRTLLQQLGVDLPETPTQERMRPVLLDIKQKIAGVEDVANLPEMRDPEKLAAMRILSSMASAAYIGCPALYPFVVLKQIALSLEFGNSVETAYAYSTYGLILCGFEGEIQAGNYAADIALLLMEKNGASDYKAKIFNLVYPFVRVWRDPLQEVINPLLSGYQAGLEFGDLEFASYCVYNYCRIDYFSGSNLLEVQNRLQNYGVEIKKFKQKTALNFHQIVHQSVLNWLGQNDDPKQLVGDVYDENVRLSEHQEMGDSYAIGSFYVHKLILNYYFAEPLVTWKIARLAEETVTGVAGTPDFGLFYFYHALALLGVVSAVSDDQQSQLHAEIARDLNQLMQWSAYAPTTYEHKCELVRAEQCRVNGQLAEAVDLYDRSIACARKNGFRQEEALANELAAKFYLAWGKEKVAMGYIQEAYYGYAHWGAKAKIEDLERLYSQLLQPLGAQKQHVSPNNTLSKQMTNSSSGSTEFLDLAAVIKASQAISGELLPTQLITTLMQMAMENAGAERGGLVLLREGQLVLMTQCISEHRCTRESMLLEESEDIPITLIHYVFRTAETLVADNMTAETRFASDPYIVQCHPKSVLCMPLMKQKQPIGALYLENNLMTGAFTSDRIKVLNVLCTQAAISFENANLYENLQTSNRILQQSLEELQQTQTKLLQATEKLQHDAFHDALTDLPNRAYFVNLLEHVIQLSKRHSENRHELYAVLFIDMDHFKMINDSFGHAIGDEFLIQVANRLQSCVRISDTVARFGGDEFAILLEEISDPSEVVEVAERIHYQLSLPFTVESYEVFAAASIGIALSTIDYQQSAHVLRDADTAMYHAKAQGRNCYAVFDPVMQTQVTTRLQLENDLRRAIEAQEFHIHYQPIVSLSTGRLRGFEALVRWNHPLRGRISPVEFIPIAEETGLIAPLGWWVLEESCRQLSHWISQFPKVSPLVMNINLSAVQLKQANLLERLESILQETKIPRDWLKLEITESCILETFTSEAKRLKLLKDMGIRLCIDDFGTGYSSLSRLHEFPIDTLKIDRTFVHRLRSNSSETVQMIVTMAHSLGMDVVAEGIETIDELKTLKQLECEFGQGYLFSAPVPAEDACEWLRSFFREKTFS